MLFSPVLRWILTLFNCNGLKKKKNLILRNLIEENVIQLGLNVLWASLGGLEPTELICIGHMCKII